MVLVPEELVPGGLVLGELALEELALEELAPEALVLEGPSPEELCPVGWFLVERHSEEKPPGARFLAEKYLVARLLEEQSLGPEEKNLEDLILAERFPVVKFLVVSCPEEALLLVEQLEEQPQQASLLSGGQ